MLDSGVLMRRALRYSLESNDLKLESLGMMDSATQDQFQQLSIL